MKPPLQVNGSVADAPTSTLDTGSSASVNGSSSTTVNSVVLPSEASSLHSIGGGGGGSVSVSVQPTTTTPSKGTGRERRCKPRKRHANFATQETNSLLSEIRRSRHILFNVISPSITPNRKVAVWEEISARLAARGWNRRNGKELRRKWENLRYETKIKFMKQLRGEQYHLKWTPLNTEVLQLMREDATYSLPSALEEWKVLPPQIHNEAPSPTEPLSHDGADSSLTPSHDGADDRGVRMGDPEKQAQQQQDHQHQHHHQHPQPHHDDSAVTADNCEDIAAAAQAMERFMCDSNKSEPSGVEIKSEGQSVSCHLMTHLSALEPDMLHPALRSIEMSGSIDDGDAPELPRTGLSQERIDSLEHHLHQQLPNFNSLNLPDPVGQNHHPAGPPSLDPLHGPPPISRFVQTGTDANAAGEARLRVEVLRMKHEAYRAKRDYYIAKIRSMCDNRSVR